MREQPPLTHAMPAPPLPTLLPGVDDGGLSLYRSIAEQLPHGALFVVDHELRYLLARGAGLRDAGFVPADFEGKRLREALPAELVDAYERDYRDILGGMPMERQHSVNGRAYASHGVPLAADDGRVRAALVVSYDVTQRQSVERRLALLDVLADALSAASDAREVESAAAALLCEHLGAVRCVFANAADRHLVLGRTALVLADFGAASLARLAAGEIAHSNASAQRDAVLPDLIRAWVLCPHLAGGVLAGVTLVASEQARCWTEDELDAMCELADRAWAHIDRLRLLAALREADRQKDRFLAVLAHELRNPLAVVRQGVALLKRPEARIAPARIVDLMERQLGHMGRLIEDVLDVSYICHGRIALRPQRLELREAVQGAVEAARALAQDKDQALLAELGGEPLPLDGDPTRLAQAIGNVLMNAIKYTPVGGTIRVACARDGPLGLIRVADDGPGMTAETLQRLFGLFARGGDSGGGQPGGLGVGMWITRQLVEAHDGTIAAASDGPGLGSTFTIALPLASPDTLR